MSKEQDASSTRPYFIRALHEWCCDNGLTPYVAVSVNDSVQVPREFVKDGEIVLNISPDATSSLKLGNDFIEFRARFGGVAREVVVPVDRVMAVYARENGQGMAFPMDTATRGAPGSNPLNVLATPSQESTTVPATGEPDARVPAEPASSPPKAPKPVGPAGRPSLKRVK